MAQGLHQMQPGPNASGLLEGKMAMNTNLGELISTIYEQFLVQYGDEELASVATAAVINDLLATTGPRRAEREEAA